MNRVPKPEPEEIPAALTPDGGKWCDAVDGSTMATIGPTTEAVITTVAKASAKSASVACANLNEAQGNSL